MLKCPLFFGVRVLARLVYFRAKAFAPIGALLTSFLDVIN